MPTKKVATKKAPAKKTAKKAPTKKTLGASKACMCREVCRPEESFWINYGPVVDSVSALRDAIKAMSEEQYHYHTTRGTNDFASWIRHCFNNEAVAGRVEKATTKAGTVKALAQCCS
jgi:hypothetical protein